jgi:plastocyanin
MNKLAVSPVIACLAVAASGCGSSGSKPASTGAGSGTAGSGAALNVTETEYKLSPANPSVASGSVQVTVHNAGAMTHALEIEGAGPGGKDLRSADISAGSTATVTASLTAGKTYVWYCPIDGHRGLGMKGTITVTSGGGSGGSNGAPGGTGGRKRHKPTFY